MSKREIASSGEIELFNQKAIKQAIIAIKLSVTLCVSLDIIYLNQQDSEVNRSKYSQDFIKREFFNKKGGGENIKALIRRYFSQ